MAGRISDADIQKVRDATDLVQLVGEIVPVKRKGRDYWCCCPLHHEKTPSFKIDPSTQLWHCFGCHEGGDIFGFVMKTEDLSFPEAVRRLAERAHIDIKEEGGRPQVNQSKKARLKDVCKETARFYHRKLMTDKGPDASKARAYLGGRGLGGKVPNAWNLGYAPGRGQLVHHLLSLGFKPDEMVEANVALAGRDGRLRDRFYERVMFPINDIQGDCIAFGGRIMGDGQPKYLNSQETPIFHKSETLYGLDQAKGAMAATGVAIVVEGYTDVIACHKAGLRNVVATLGTALTRRHIRILSRHAKKAIVYLFDGDAAGQKAADRALGFIDSSMTPEGGRTPIELRAVTLPDNQDPAEFIEAHGVDELRQIIDGSKQLLQYGIDRRLASYDLGTPEGRSAAMTDALSVLAPIKDSVLAQQYAAQIASATRMRESVVLDALRNLKPLANYDDDDAAPQGRPGMQAGGAGGFAAPQSRGLSSAERSRRQFERNLLALCVRNPLVGLGCADRLSTVQFHVDIHARIAAALLDAWAENPHASAAELLTRISARVPSAAAVITEPQYDEGADLARLADYLCEELVIGDMEDAIAAMKSNMRGQENEMFELVSAMQHDLETKRAAHKPL